MGIGDIASWNGDGFLSSIFSNVTPYGLVLGIAWWIFDPAGFFEKSMSNFGFPGSERAFLNGSCAHVVLHGSVPSPSHKKVDQ